MGYVPGFTNDVFISYAHIDDQAVTGDGWVTDFHRRLIIEVEEALGEKVQVWRDQRITGATDFTKDLDKQVRGSAILLAILSPSYMNSRWCDWELTGFAGSRRTGDLWIDTKCRALKVFKRPADVGRLRVLAETEGVSFFTVDSAKNDVPHELEASSDLYKHRLAELAHDIGFVLRAMRKSRTVFLGTASGPLLEQRERVRKELTGRNYRILTTPDDLGDDRQRQVKDAVAESALSVLFYDRTASPDDPSGELATLERRAAMQQQATQIIAVRGQPDLAPQPWEEPDATGRGSAKVEWLIEPQMHELYHTVLQMLQAQPGPTPSGPISPPAADPAQHPDVSESPAAVAAAGAGSRTLTRIYMVCDQRDHPLLESNRARRLRDHLLSLGFEVRLPLAEQEDAGQFSRDNRNKLKQCDGVLLYWGAARQAWFDQRLDELTQARGWRQGRAFAALGAYVADPQSPVKQNYETLALDELIKQFDTLDLADSRLVRFVARLGQATT